MHPLSGNLADLKDSEIESKIQDLTKKYFMTNNSEVKHQISSLLENYNQEIGRRRQIALAKLMENSGKDLDKLIKVN